MKAPLLVLGIAETDEDPNEHERIIFHFHLQGADADGGARVLGVHQRGEGIARSRPGPAFGIGLARPIGNNRWPAWKYQPTLAEGHDRRLGAASKSIERRDPMVGHCPKTSTHT